MSIVQYDELVSGSMYGSLNGGKYDPILESLTRNLTVPSKYSQPTYTQLTMIPDFRIEANSPAVITNHPKFGTATHKDKVASLRFIKTTRVLEFFESDVYYPGNDLTKDIERIIFSNVNIISEYKDLLGFIEGDWIIFLTIPYPVTISKGNNFLPWQIHT